MKFVKIWQGVVTGSFAGRDDGYPETKVAVIDSIEQLVNTYDPKASYFKCEPVQVAETVENIKRLGFKS